MYQRTTLLLSASARNVHPPMPAGAPDSGVIFDGSPTGCPKATPTRSELIVAHASATPGEPTEQLAVNTMSARPSDATMLRAAARPRSEGSDINDRMTGRGHERIVETAQNSRSSATRC